MSIKKIAASHPSILTPDADHYEALYHNFRWHVPEFFNIAQACCTRWAQSDSSRIALRCENETGHVSTLSYAQLQSAANQLSNALRSLGVQRGDRVALVLPQRIETAIAHIALYQLGAVAMPLSILFGQEALAFRLQNSETVLAIADASVIDTVQSVRHSCSQLKQMIVVEPVGASTTPYIKHSCTSDWQTLLNNHPKQFKPVQTRADEAAVLIYTSGTTGAPKGALIPHAALIGNLPGFVASQNWFPQEGDVFWSPADWAWTGGLMDALLPTLYFGKTIIGYHGRFSAETAFYLLEKYHITNSFLFPTALKMMMKAYPTPRTHFKLKLRAIMSAGEAVGDAVFTWCQQALGVTANEMFGQTEINYIVGNSAAYGWPARAGSMGKPYPGHHVAVIDEAGNVCKTGEVGDVALNHRDIHGHPDPVFFLGYWKNQAATESKTTHNQTGQAWCRTGDLAYADAQGYLWYAGRADDMFKAAGYRIGPAEIENCLVKHPAVANAAVVPKPDAERGNIVKAFVVLTPEYQQQFKNDAHNMGDSQKARARLILALQAHVRAQLAPYEYPKEIEFIDALPMTTTGKVQRRVLRLLEEERQKERTTTSHAAT